ncbi:MAG: YbgC/FadM family acyl-CoA thioesterase [Pseudomonadota bacterium]
MATTERSHPTTGTLQGATHVFPVRVYYEDTDFTGIVYHARHLHFFERGRTEWLRTLGVSHTELADGRFGEVMAFAIQSVAVDYKKPARVDDVLEVTTSLKQARGARLILDQSMNRPLDGELIAKAEVAVVLINGSGAPRRVPAEMLALIEGS